MTEDRELAQFEEDDDEEESSDALWLKNRPRRARRVLLGALLVIVASMGVYGIWPWLLPPFIYEGPLVQMSGEREVVLAWYMTRPVTGEFVVNVAQADGLAYPVEADGNRCRAVLTDLEPGQSYEYRISLDGKVLKESELRTARSVGEPFKFLVFGDSGRGTQEQYRLGAQMNAANPDFLLHTGDVVYGRGERHKYRERFFLPYEDLLQRVNLWPSLGNHDILEPSLGEPYLEIFELPENGPHDLRAEHNYWFDYAGARIAVVDSNLDEGTLRDEVAPWLREVLTDCEADWKFVLFHHPPYTAGRYKPNKKIQNTLVPVIESTSVDVVFNGHDHMHQRLGPILGGELAEEGTGVVYVISGAGGAGLYDAVPPEQRPDWVMSLHDEIHSFTSVAVVSQHELIIEQVALGGVILDKWTLHKPEQAE